MPLRLTRHDRDEPTEPPIRSLQERVQRLEAIVTLFVRHIRGTDVMSEEELEGIERDLQV